MKFTQTFSMLLVVLITLAAGAAMANDKASSSHHFAKSGFGKHHGNRGHFGMQQQFFKQIDADADGEITQQELDTFRAAKVKAADANKDGALSLKEFEPVYQEMTRTRMVRAFQGLDSNGNGVISKEEMDDRFGNMMQRMDKKRSQRQQ
ncbi:MAG TPA: hypothetical protein VJY63_05345 [Marinospirillum sp.]|uniref:EF-hand domain-containing protein n=1 Tax=Marinospirillum sp. TaxID=2183934 RepID=UPI002B462B30|nr:hypothetical protein [Marinospirillum sp.]HKM15332.1 hypothetical protein [Marinospirillum sp.]